MWEMFWASGCITGILLLIVLAVYFCVTKYSHSISENEEEE